MSTLWKEHVSNWPERENFEYLYHTTYAEHIPKIVLHGLVPNKNISVPGYSTARWVSLAPSLRDALYWSSVTFHSRKNRGIVSTPILLRVKKEAVISIPIRLDERITGKISPELLDIWNGSKWNKIWVRG